MGEKDDLMVIFQEFVDIVNKDNALVRNFNDGSFFHLNYKELRIRVSNPYFNALFSKHHNFVFDKENEITSRTILSYWVEGYVEGYKYFMDNYFLPSNKRYSDNSERYVDKLTDMYFKKRHTEFETPFGKLCNLRSSVIAGSKLSYFHKVGYYSAYANIIEDIVDEDKSLFKSFTDHRKLIMDENVRLVELHKKLRSYPTNRERLTFMKNNPLSFETIPMMNEVPYMTIATYSAFFYSIKGTPEFENYIQTDFEVSKEEFTFENKFDDTDPTEVYNYFKFVLVDKCGLEVKQLEDYLKLAFEKKTIPEQKFSIISDKTIGQVKEYFYTFYDKIINNKHGNQARYSSLLSDYFTGHIKGNFKGDSNKVFKDYLQNSNK